MLITNFTLSIPTGPQSQILTMVAATPQATAAAFTLPNQNAISPSVAAIPVMILPEVGMYVRQSPSGACTADGTDHWLAPNILVHTDVALGNKLGFNGPNAGIVHITTGG